LKLIDTTVAVDYLRGLPAAVGFLQETLLSGEELGASELVRFELIAGARASELDILDRFLSALLLVPVGAAVARVGGRLARDHRRSHSGIDDVDYLTAATALVVGAELLTTNVRHFPMIEGLQAPY
jgi:predicted nucleic acid-binding protein